MVGNVIEMAGWRRTHRHAALFPVIAYNAWVADEVECQQCRHVWVAVRAMGADYTTLECPECSAFDSDFYEPPNEFHPAPTEH